jgi:glycosyltransferase involved in cell wall biosynthesis
VIDLAHRYGLPGSTPTAVIPGETPSEERFTPVSASERETYRRKLGLPLDRPIIGFVGRLVPEKGVLDAISAVRHVRIEHSPVLLIWGAGPLSAQLTSANGEGYVYMGSLELADVPAALQSCDIVVMPSKATPSWKEQFGRVAVEAMLSGRPVIAYRSGALPAVLDDGALFVNEGDVQGLTSTLTRLLDKEEERSMLAARGREIALSRFHPDRVARRIIDFWNTVAHRGPARAGA